MTPLTEEESRAYYERAMKLLTEYNQKVYLVTIRFGGVREFHGIEVYSSALSIEDKADHIKDLLAGMGFCVSFNKNSETITIK